MRKKVTVITTVVILIIISILIAFKNNSKTSHDSYGFDRNQIDLGILPVEAMPIQLKNVLVFNNKSKNAVSILSIESTCSCVSGTMSKSIPIGQKSELDVAIKSPVTNGSRKVNLLFRIAITGKEEKFVVPVTYSVSEYYQFSPEKLNIEIGNGNLKEKSEVYLKNISDVNELQYSRYKFVFDPEGAVDAKVKYKNLIRDNAGREMIDMAIDWSVLDSFDEAKGYLEVSWFDKKKFLPIQIKRRQDYSLSNRDIVIVPFVSGETINKTVYLKRTDNTPFKINLVKSNVEWCRANLNNEKNASQVHKINLQVNGSDFGPHEGLVEVIVDPPSLIPIYVNVITYVSKK